LEDLSLEEIEQLFIRQALARHGGDVRRAAEQLGLSRSALYRRLQQMPDGSTDTPDRNDDNERD
jgi:DNA-binding NtrC family response regulator